jgi:hypothetical protein
MYGSKYRGIMSKRGRAIASSILAIAFIGVVFVVNHFLAYPADGVTTTGTVIDPDFSSKLSDEGNILYSPLIEFVSLDGETISFASNTYSSNTYQTGQEIEVIYSPTSPEDAQLKSFLPRLFIIVFGVAAGICTLLAAFFIWQFVKEHRQQKAV